MSHWLPHPLKTERLILRSITEQDANSIFEYSSNPNVAKYTLWDAHRSISDTLAFIHEYVFAHYKEEEPEPWGITFKENPEKVIGTVGCFWISKPHQTMELGYALSELHWGKGIVVEAAQAVIPYIFKNYQTVRIQAPCVKENRGSRRVIEKLGMQFEGELRSARFCKGKFWDIHLCALLKD